MSEYAVLYLSVTGNTEKIAAAIYQSISSSSKDICKIDGSITTDFAENYFIGFYLHQGLAPEPISAFLKKLHGKNIALFGTCGYGFNQSYFNHIESKISNIIPFDNNYLGCFLCQGKMPITIRNEYEKKLLGDEKNYILNNLIKNFDNAMLHPNEEDIKNAETYAQEVIWKLKGN
ncbi:flavodoxin [Lachnotalea glycerini]|nr:flavodoxin family protein [Lachnotalea glycerini]PXV96248.1 flavodoxin [Lachnotalea glycerini]